jgi:hypothetical protein
MAPDKFFARLCALVPPPGMRPPHLRQTVTSTAARARPSWSPRAAATSARPTRSRSPASRRRPLRRASPASPRAAGWPRPPAPAPPGAHLLRLLAGERRSQRLDLAPRPPQILLERLMHPPEPPQLRVRPREPGRVEEHPIERRTLLRQRARERLLARVTLRRRALVRQLRRELVGLRRHSLPAPPSAALPSRRRIAHIELTRWRPPLDLRQDRQVERVDDPGRPVPLAPRLDPA